MKTNSLRVLLDEKAFADLQEMIKEIQIEEEFIKINPSNLSAWIIKSFKERYYKTCKKEIAQDHFNSRAYLTEMAKRIQGQGDAKEILQEALEKMRRPVIKKNQTN